jgi:tryptophan-rich sensory protein
MAGLLRYTHGSLCAPFSPWHFSCYWCPRLPLAGPSFSPAPFFLFYPFVFYGLQLTANAAWSWLFFGRHLMLWGLADIVLLLGLILANTVLFWRIDRLAGGLLIPYAATLNGGIILLNR